MTCLRAAVHDYLAMRRNLGFKLRDAGPNLYGFVDFLEQNHRTFITQSLALSWVQQFKNIQPISQAVRLRSIRVFARYYRAFDPRTEIPSPGLLPVKAKRARPYIYTEQEITDLLHAASTMPYRRQNCALMPMTYYCFFGLLAVTGLRRSEARNLELKDVDLKAGVLTIRNTKFGKTRLVPLHSSTCTVLANYIIRRQEHWKKYHKPGQQLSPCLFTTSRGKPLHLSNVYVVFCKLCLQVGLRKTIGRGGPRMHDMRHRFATLTLTKWYQTGQDPERLLPHLATYLGHADVKNTQWYLESCPELMRGAMSRLNKYWEDQL